MKKRKQRRWMRQAGFWHNGKGMLNFFFHKRAVYNEFLAYAQQFDGCDRRRWSTDAGGVIDLEKKQMFD